MKIERNLQKHKITREELEFLITLQKELNTQDTVCQADPRFWVVQQSVESVTAEGYEDTTVIIDTEDYETIAEDIDEFIQYVKENFIEEDKLDNYVIENNNGYYNILVKNVNYNPEIDNEYNKYDEEYENIDDLEGIISCFESLNIIKVNRFNTMCLKKERQIVPNTFFLTNKECKEHIRLNHYHYDNPCSYAMTAWRSPEVSMLWDILQKVDWSLMATEE